MDEQEWQWVKVGELEAPRRAEGLAASPLPERFATRAFEALLPRGLSVRAKADDGRVLLVDVGGAEARPAGSASFSEAMGAWVLDGRAGEARLEIESQLTALRLLGDAVWVGRRGLASADEALAGWTLALPLLEAPPVAAWLAAWPHHAWFAAEVTRLAALPDSVSRASAAGAFVRLWSAPRGSVTPTELIERESPAQLAFAWFSAQPANARDVLETALVHEVPLLQEQLELIAAAPREARGPLVQWWLTRRDDLANAEALLGALAAEVTDSLGSLERLVAARGEAFAGQRFPSDERLVAARIADAHAWWAYA